MVYCFTSFKLRRLGLPPTAAELLASGIAKKCALLSPELRGVWLSKNWNDEKLKDHAKLVKNIRLAMSIKPL